jgi:SNF family Na+-dependent transporter
MIPYLVAFLLLGLPLMWIEWTIGRFGGASATARPACSTPSGKTASSSTSRHRHFWACSFLSGYISNHGFWVQRFALTSKYRLYRRGWMRRFLGYQGLVKNEHFSGIIWYCFFCDFCLNILFVWYSRWDERVCKWGLLVLFILAIVIVIRVLTLGTPDAAKPDWNPIAGLGFLWNPQWEKLRDAKVWLSAAGQIFFTLSAGFGVILTYASYLTKQDDVALSGRMAATTNEVAE